MRIDLHPSCGVVVSLGRTADNVTVDLVDKENDKRWIFNLTAREALKLSGEIQDQACRLIAETRKREKEGAPCASSSST